MSKERARRRAVRETAASADRERRARERARARRRARLRSHLTSPLTSSSEPRSALARQRRRENGLLLAGLVPLNVAVWLLTPSWWWRGSAVGLSLLAWPLLTVLFFDRRPSS